MKTLVENPNYSDTYYAGGEAASSIAAELPYAIISQGFTGKAHRKMRPSALTDSAVAPVLTAEAADAMRSGTIPNLEQLCRELNNTFLNKSEPHTALQFIPILKKLTAISDMEMEWFLMNPKTSHVLVKNDQLKVVLIHWTPDQFSSVHGHAQGGCVFKVLKGKVQEKRYTPDDNQHLLATGTFQAGSMAYIDDEMAYHAVGNPFDSSAVSLHVYTPGS